MQMEDTQQKQVEPLGGEDPQEEEMATQASIPAWRVPWTEEPADHSTWGRREPSY